MSDRVGTDLVGYALDGPVATLTMDDGKVNVLSFAMFDGITAALDRAQADGAGAVVLAGRPERFSAGFDLAIVRRADGLDLVRTGFEMSLRLLAFPVPVVVACTGHAIAMGSFLLLSGDLRIGADGPYKITANEVAIGMTLPLAAVELLRSRLTPAAFQRAVGLAAIFSPTDAVVAGYLDQTVAPEALLPAAQEAARALTELHQDAHAASKLRARSATLAAMRDGIDAELVTNR
jgi:enoyl-CoA hydratase